MSTSASSQRQPVRRAKERRWFVLGDGCLHGIRHSELTVVRSVPHRQFQRTTVSVFTLSKRAALVGMLVLAALLVILLVGCQGPGPQRGGTASTTITRPGHTNAVTLAQSDSPKEPSRQTVESEQLMEFVLPAGSELSFGDSSSQLGVRGAARWMPGTQSPGTPLQAPSPSESASATLREPMPVKCLLKDRTDTRVGGAQKDVARELAARAATMQPVMWAGIAMMTVVAGALIYFGWWTKGAVAMGVGVMMIVLAQALPAHGTLILIGGLGVFASAALLVLYSYYKGRLDQNHNGIPDFLERSRDVPF